MAGFPKEIKIPIKVDMQDYYDSLCLQIKSMEAQRDVLAADVSICTHRVEFRKQWEGPNPKNVVMCSLCGKIISGDFDYVRWQN